MKLKLTVEMQYANEDEVLVTGRITSDEDKSLCYTETTMPLNLFVNNGFLDMAVKNMYFMLATELSKDANVYVMTPDVGPCKTKD